MLASEENALRIHTERLVEVASIDVPDGLAVSAVLDLYQCMQSAPCSRRSFKMTSISTSTYRNPSIITHDIQSPILLHRLSNQRRNIVFIRRIGFHESRSTAILLDVLMCRRLAFFARCWIEIGTEYCGAFFG